MDESTAPQFNSINSTFQPTPAPATAMHVRRAGVAKAELPIKLDAKLVQIRLDAEQSKAQLANKRLTGVQDLAWALINNPAFLFNH